MSEHPIIDTLSTRKPAPTTATLLDEPVTVSRPDGIPDARIAPAPRPAPEQHPVPTVGSFFAEQRAIVDARRGDLARVGMLPQHVSALAMPDLIETPRAPAVNMATLPSGPGKRPLKMPMEGTAVTTDAGYHGQDEVE